MQIKADIAEIPFLAIAHYKQVFLQFENGYKNCKKLSRDSKIWFTRLHIRVSLPDEVSSVRKSYSCI